MQFRKLCMIKKRWLKYAELLGALYSGPLPGLIEGGGGGLRAPPRPSAYYCIQSSILHIRIISNRTCCIIIGENVASADLYK